MKKNGFTLAEMLITMGIVGVVSALVAPIMVNIMPDKNKAMFIKNYKELKTINQQLLEDRTIYYSTKTLDLETGRKTSSCQGLQCEETPLRSPFKGSSSASSIYTGANKYPYLLANFLGIDEPDDTSFTTKDNTIWSITRNVDESTGKVSGYSVVLTVSGTGTACTYSDECKHPKSFELDVDIYGRVTPVDALSKAYILTETKLNNKKADLEKAAEIYAELNSAG